MVALRLSENGCEEKVGKNSGRRELNGLGGGHAGRGSRIGETKEGQETPP